MRKFKKSDLGSYRREVVPGETIDDIFSEDGFAFFMKAYFDESGKHAQAPVVLTCLR